METKKKNKITSGNNPLEKKLTCPKSVVVCQGLLHALLPSTRVTPDRQEKKNWEKSKEEV